MTFLHHFNFTSNVQNNTAPPFSLPVPVISTSTVSLVSTVTPPVSAVSPPVTTIIGANTPLAGTTNSGHGRRLSEAQFTAIMVSVALLIALLLGALAYIFYSRRTKRRNSPPEFVDVFPPNPLETQHVQATEELHKPRENIQTRFFEADWTNSFYSQSSATLDDGYQARKGKMHSFAYSYPESLDVRDRRHSFDQDTEEGSTVYAM
ncbi:hypothetical protein DFH06DRAFT_179493 [Mycena polygramma]|nr:hypothetical protein DFH06DRAFT_179493 [Mycena polygramma]